MKLLPHLRVATVLISSSLLAAGCTQGDGWDFESVDAPADSDDDAGDPLDDEPAAGDTDDAPEPTDEPDEPEDPADDAETDTEAPYVVSVTPEDGTRGVMQDAEIVFTFSEPMDQASTASAWLSADLPLSTLTMSWNEAGDVLTITPNDGLLYASNYDVVNPPALEYAFVLANTATDLAGNPLEDGVSASFHTARSFEVSLPIVGGLSGSVANDGETWQDEVDVGDTADLRQVKGLVSFDLTELPDQVLAWRSARLELQHVYEGPDVWNQMGSLILSDADFDNLATGFDAEVAAVDSYCGAGAPQMCSLEVSDIVLSDYEAGALRTQFSLAFETTTDDDAADDQVAFELGSNDSQIVVEYLVR